MIWDLSITATIRQNKNEMLVHYSPRSFMVVIFCQR